MNRTNTVAGDHDERPEIARRKDEIRRMLVEYLATCPKAMDTLQGIADFWLPRQRVRTEVALLVEVVTELAAEGVLESIGAGAGRMYRLSSRSSQ